MQYQNQTFSVGNVWFRILGFVYVCHGDVDAGTWFVI